jgi:hypothetical protein
MKSPHLIVLEARAMRIERSGEAGPFPPFLPELRACPVAAGTLFALRFHQFALTLKKW